MDAPVDARIANRKRDVQPDIDGEEVSLQVDLAKDPQTQQRAQKARCRAGGADGQIRGRVDEVADHRAEDRGGILGRTVRWRLCWKRAEGGTLVSEKREGERRCRVLKLVPNCYSRVQPVLPTAICRIG